MDGLYSLKVELHRAWRLLRWVWEARGFSRPEPEAPDMQTLIFRHSSPLVRDPARAEADLQAGKIRNLQLTVPRLDGTVIRPGQVFSLAYLAGRATRRAGYQPGLELRDGRIRPGIGGGRCQVSNLLYWMALHLDLEIVERHRHDYDLFPDAGRTLPFGSGATFFWNYLDLQVRNPHAFPIYLRLRLTDKELVGEAYAPQPLAYGVRVVETDHRFFREGGFIWRENRLWREVFKPGSGSVLRRELVAHNRCRVLYPVAESALADAPVPPREKGLL